MKYLFAALVFVLGLSPIWALQVLLMALGAPIWMVVVLGVVGGYGWGTVYGTWFVRHILS